MKLEHTLTPCTKINSKWLNNSNVKQDTIKLLEENMDKTFSDINLTNVFSGQSPKATEIKAKINQWDLSNCSQSNRNKSKNKQMGPNQSDKLLHSKRNHKKKQKDNLQNGRT